MSGLTTTEAAATLDARFPTTGGGDYVAYSTDGSSEFSGLARTEVGATGWAAATTADPSVKANAADITSAAATDAGTITHTAIFSAATGGSQRTDWQAVTTSRTVAVGDQVKHAAGDLQITLS